MGGDFAPRATIAGALLALQELDGAHTVQLVGQTSVIEAEVARLLSGELSGGASSRHRLIIVEAPEVIEMSEKPTAGLRKKPNSSMVVGLKLQVDGESDAFVSAGNTGAQMASSVFLLKLHHGLTRPAIAAMIPTLKHPVVLVDAGANVDCSAEELVQFARLGSVYAEDILMRPEPAIGLLSNGEEPEKGNASVKEAHKLLSAAGLNFVGNVEGRDILTAGSSRGALDVVVCDGFVGNVLLKFYEAIAPLMIETLRKAGVDGAQLEAGLKHLDYSEHGGAPLLGVRGVSIIAHGKSSPRAIKNALKAAAQAVTSGMNDLIGQRLGTVTESAA